MEMSTLNNDEDSRIALMDDKRMFDMIMPAIREVVKSGGGADAILKKSEPLAAMKLIEATNSDKDEVRLKAATEILNRTLGRPVERSLNLHADVGRLSDKDLDSQIARLMSQSGAREAIIDATLSVEPTPTKKRKTPKAPKPRKSKLIEEIAVEAARPEEPNT